MKRTAIALVLLLCLSLSGCRSLLTGEYIWQQTHYIPPASDSGQNITASDYAQLLTVLTDAIEEGMEQFTVAVDEYSLDTLEADVARATETVCRTNPVAAYAVSNIDWQIGTTAEERMLLVQIKYLHGQSEIKQIQNVADTAGAIEAIWAAMNDCRSSLVLRIDAYEQADFAKTVETYALENPQYVMEMPQVSVHIYPESGASRVVEILFDYINGQDALQDMQQQVLKLFDASVNIVSITEKTKDKYSRLYSMLVDSFPKYTIESSVTPAYSLLVHGQGDSKAFALVYAAMCREAGLSCQVVIGTKNSNIWYWNIVLIDGVYYHVDLLRSKGEGSLRLLTDSIANEGYAWDVSAYPACGETK